MEFPPHSKSSPRKCRVFSLGWRRSRPVVFQSVNGTYYLSVELSYCSCSYLDRLGSGLLLMRKIICCEARQGKLCQIKRTTCYLSVYCIRIAVASSRRPSPSTSDSTTERIYLAWTLLFNGHCCRCVAGIEDNVGAPGLDQPIILPSSLQPTPNLYVSSSPMFHHCFIFMCRWCSDDADTDTQARRDRDELIWRAVEKRGDVGTSTYILTYWLSRQGGSHSVF